MNNLNRPMLSLQRAQLALMVVSSPVCSPVQRSLKQTLQPSTLIDSAFECGHGDTATAQHRYEQSQLLLLGFTL
jgi:hypothetical protein